MHDVIQICVVDCAAKLSDYRRQYDLSDENILAILLAGCTHELNHIYVDPILTHDANINMVTASRLTRGIKELVRENTAGSIAAVLHNASDIEILNLDYELSGDLVIVKIGLREEED